MKTNLPRAALSPPLLPFKGRIFKFGITCLIYTSPRTPCPLRQLEMLYSKKVKKVVVIVGRQSSNRGDTAREEAACAEGNYRLHWTRIIGF